MKSFWIIALSLALLSCHPSKEPSQTADKTSSPTVAGNSATISASPNPILHGPERGQTTITWDTGSGRQGEVCVSENGAAEKLVASGEAGTKALNWIRTGSHYEFRLYEGSPHAKLLGKVQVTHQP